MSPAAVDATPTLIDTIYGARTRLFFPVQVRVRKVRVFRSTGISVRAVKTTYRVTYHRLPSPSPRATRKFGGCSFFLLRPTGKTRSSMRHVVYTVQSTCHATTTFFGRNSASGCAPDDSYRALSGEGRAFDHHSFLFDRRSTPPPRQTVQ